VTLLNDSMGYIHTCSLRWSLHREGKLDFNSNLRLLTSAKRNRPNSAIPNAIYLAGIVLSYGSTSLIFLSLNPQLARLLGKDYDNADVNGVHINSIALFTLGGGFLLQAIITNWALAQTDIPTWSSNPLDVALACTYEHDGHRVVRRVGRCMMGVHLTKKIPGLYKPIPRQRPMITAHPHVRWILALLWALPILSGIWGGGVYAYILRDARKGVLGRSWSLLPVFTGNIDTNCRTHQCTDGTSVLNVGWSASNGTAGTVGAVFLIMGFQSVVTLSLHCAELIVNLARDEKVYRALIGPKGTNGHYNSILAACTSWRTLFLFALKAGVHWMFGLAINLQFRLGVNMQPPQIFYFAGFSLAAAVFGLLLSLWRPGGYLPPSYGHVQTIVDIVDEWAPSGCMYWGEKDAVYPGYTGTSTHPLPEPSETRLYGGQHDGRHPGPAWASAAPTELRNLSPSPTTPTVYSPGFTSLHPYHSQWAQQAHQAQNRSSQNSLNSAYSGRSGRSGRSGYSTQSTQPLLSGYNIG
jgi:hypothetical protein